MTRHTEIAGAGIAGLAVACQLAEVGWSVQVHERFSDVREIGAGIAVGQNGVDALRRIGAFDEAIKGGTKISYWSIEDQWNRVVHGEDLATELYSVPRSSLQRALHLRALDLGVNIKTDSQAVGVSQGRLELENGQQFDADLIVGADGVWSRIRSSLMTQGLKAKKIDLRVAGLRAIIPRLESDPVDHMLEWISGKRRCGFLPLDSENIAIYMFCPSQDHLGREVPLDVESWSSSFPMLRTAFERVSTDSTWSDVVEVHCNTWVHGNTALIGDAAFGMAPNLGQGGCTAMQAAVSLAGHLVPNQDVSSALKKWEHDERSHIDYVQKWSGRYSRLCSKTPTPGLRARSTLFRVLARSEKLNNRFAGVEARLMAS